MVEVVLSTLDSTLIFYFIDCFNDRETESNFKIAMAVIIQSLVMVAFSSFKVTNNFPSKILMICIMCIIIKQIYYISLPKIFLMLTCVAIYIGVIELIAAWIMILFFNVPYDFMSEKSVDYVIFGITTKILILPMIKYLALSISKLKLLNRKLTYQISLVLMINVLVILTGGWFYQYIDISRINIPTFLTIIITSVIIFSYFTISLTKKLIDFTVKEIEWSLKEEGYKDQINYVKTMDEMFNNLKAQRHEFSNYISTIDCMLINKDYEVVENYIRELKQSINEYNQIVKTSNPVLSSLLSVKYQTAVKQDIDINFKELAFDKLEMKFIDLTVILGNILDNAITACSKIEDEQKAITLNMFHNQGHFCIHMRNSKSKGVIYKNGGRYTSKEKKDDHGYGLGNVRYVVNKYHGSIKVTDEGEIFDLKIYFPNKTINSQKC